MFRKMPFVLLGMIFLILLVDQWIPLPLKQAIYAVSLNLKSLIVFVLPFLIFMLLFNTISQLSKNATKMIAFILAAICCSNFISTMISYQVGTGVYQLDLSMAMPSEENGLTPAWSFSLPKLVANDHAMFAGILLGIVLPRLSQGGSNYLSIRFERLVGYLLQLLTLIIPVFISGFILKLIHDDVLTNIITDYSLIFLLVAASVFGYIGCVYFLCNRCKLSGTIDSIKNMVPAAIAGFSSMSSAAAMPLTIIGAEKNSPNSPLARLAIPVTVNTHLIGDCFAIPIFAFAVMKNFGVEQPLFYSYLLFSLYFVMAKFSVAAIPGGGIIVMLPILEGHLGFTPEMASFITALYILFDPVITCANVCGNGAFALALTKLQALFTKEAESAVQEV